MGAVGTIAELLSLTGVHKGYPRGDWQLPVLEDVELEVCPREIVAVIGSRNEGKTTLLQIAAGLQQPDQGEVWLGDVELTRCSDLQREQLLGHEIAWIDREGGGLDFKVLEYVALPLVMGRRRGKDEAKDAAMKALKLVGAQEYARSRHAHLSNWQRVLVAFARGIAGGPRLMVVDDLIDGLGKTRTREAGELLRSFVKELGCGVLMSASDREATVLAERVWCFEGGGLKLIAGKVRAAAADVIDMHERARRLEDPRGTDSRGTDSRGTGS
jgi:putative ABC transport system ATP-binding protein